MIGVMNLGFSLDHRARKRPMQKLIVWERYKIISFDHAFWKSAGTQVKIVVYYTRHEVKYLVISYFYQRKQKYSRGILCCDGQGHVRNSRIFSPQKTGGFPTRTIWYISYQIKCAFCIQYVFYACLKITKWPVRPHLWVCQQGTQGYRVALYTIV